MSSEGQLLGTCLSGQKLTLESVVHVMRQITRVAFMLRIPVHWCLCRDPTLVGKKAKQVLVQPVIKGCWKGASTPKISSVLVFYV